jgi:hypothetical protein
MEGLSFLKQHPAAEDQAIYGDPGGAEIHPPVKRDPFDPAPLAELFDRFHGQIDAMKAQAAAVVVTDQASHDTALTMAGEAGQIKLRIEKERKRLVAPYLDMQRSINAFANPLIEALDAIRKRLESAKSQWAIEQDRKRRAAEEEARRLAELIRRQAEAEAAEKLRVAMAEVAERNRMAAEEAARNNAPPPPVEVAPPPEPVIIPAMPAVPVETRTRVETATSSVDLVWDFEITSLHVLLNNAALLEARRDEIEKAVKPWVNAQVKAGVRGIAGVSIFQTEKVKTRVRR